VTVSSLMRELQPFKGKQIIECIDAITAIASERHYSVNVMDPEFNVSFINDDTRRLNVQTDKESEIIAFTVG
jgi:hypothetical protein